MISTLVQLVGFAFLAAAGYRIDPVVGHGIVGLDLLFIGHALDGAGKVDVDVLGAIVALPNSVIRRLRRDKTAG